MLWGGGRARAVAPLRLRPQVAVRKPIPSPNSRFLTPNSQFLDLIHTLYYQKYGKNNPRGALKKQNIY